MIRDAYARALEEYGSAALGYGHNPGALPLRAQLAARATAQGGRPCGPEHVVVTAGTSQALYLLATSLAAPGDTVLVEALGYDLGQRIFRDCALRPRRVAMDESGMLPDALDRALAEGAPDGAGARGRVAFVYLTPTHHNPTGATMPLERRHRLLQVAAERGVLVVEDDAYGELVLTDDPAPSPSLAALAGYRGVVRLCSFSKTLGPGLRLGWLVTDPALAERIASHGLFVSGGSLNHITSLAVSGLLADGGYDQHLGALRSLLRQRRDALVGALREATDDRIRIHRPQGGSSSGSRVTSDSVRTTSSPGQRGPVSGWPPVAASAPPRYRACVWPSASIRPLCSNAPHIGWARHGPATRRAIRSE